MNDKDIHKWTTNGRYALMFDEHTFFVFDKEKDKEMTALQTTKRLNKQQDTIFKLQDLCGKSDGENMKLRIENKKLQEENEQLREELSECEKFRYSVFKGMEKIIEEKKNDKGGIMVDWWYYNNLFGVEDGLFYENNKRLGYYQDEKEDEIIKNNHKATVDRMLELKELNVEFKRIHKKLKKENKELKKEIENLHERITYFMEVGDRNDKETI